jgi:hypothetical protein
MDGIFEMIDILLTISDEGMTFDSVEDCGKEILRRYKARHDAEQNED